ncbi:hypothetical protein ACFL54_08485 [Planctomycetota bacterium]
MRILVLALVAVIVMNGVAFADKDEHKQEEHQSFSAGSLIEPMGLATLSLLCLTGCAGFFMRKKPKVLRNLHKGLGATTVISAFTHAILIFIYY